MSLDDWYKKWFYVHEEPNTIMLCDMGYIWPGEEGKLVREA